MITENEQWFIASEPVKNSHYMSNYFFTSKDDLLLEKFSVVTKNYNKRISFHIFCMMKSEQIRF